MTAGIRDAEASAELEDRVVRDLANFRAQNDIVKYVCEATGMRWDEATLYVKMLEERHRPRLSASRKPLLLALGLGLALGGLAIAGAVAAATMDGWVIFLLGLPIPYLGNAVYFGFGILVTAGALAGSWRLFTRDE